MKVYIPSYFGGNPTLVEKRLSIHQRQLSWLLSSDRLEKIIVCSQNYPLHAKLVHEKIEYIDSEPKGSSAARNVLLKKFYDSQDEICLFMDDDVIGNFCPDLLLDIVENLDANWDLLGMMPHGHIVVKEVPSNFTFKRKSLFSSAAFFMKKSDIYFDENLEGLVDVDFAIRAMIRGLSFYEIEKDCLFDHSIAMNSSVMFEGKNRWGMYKEIRKRLKVKYDAILKERGFSSMQSFINSYPEPKVVKIDTSNFAKKYV